MKKWLKRFAAAALAAAIALGGLGVTASPGEEAAALEGYGDDAVFPSQEELQAIEQHEQLMNSLVDGADRGELLDTDGDGFPDVWETNGIDFDGDGTIDYPLHLMGADPEVPDVYVEIDWMEGMNDASGQSYLNTCAEEFKKHGINLHIDFGPDSIDYVTGEAWSSYPGGSGGNALEFDTGAAWSKLDTYYNTQMSRWRKPVFHYFALVYSTDAGAGGRAYVHSMKGMINYTSAFMHELGHNLGLGHGGCEGGVYDQDNYKPNYFSVMNYSICYDLFTYSDWKLPDLDENNLSETTPLDPEGLLDGYAPPRNREKFNYFYRNGSTKVTVKGEAIGQPIDYNGNGAATDTGLQMDLNRDNKQTVLKGTNDWDNLKIKNSITGSTYGVMNTITYASPGMSGVENMPEVQTKLWSASATLSDKVPTCKGYEFLGWSTTNDRSVEYLPGSVYSGEDSIGLRAVWKLIGTPIALSVPVNITQTAAKYQHLFSFTPSVSGTYTLAATSKYITTAILIEDDICSGRTLYSKEANTGANPTPNWNTVVSYELEAGTEYFFRVYTRWAPISPYDIVLYYGDAYQVNFDGNGGTVKNSDQSRVKIPGLSLELPTAKPTRSGWIFKGWADNAQAAAAQYQPGDIYTQDATATLYALWEDQPLVASVEPSGFLATVAGENIVIHFRNTVEAVAGKTINLRAFERTWNYDEAGNATPNRTSSYYSHVYTIKEDDAIVSGTGSACVATIPMSAFGTGGWPIARNGKDYTAIGLTLEGGSFVNTSGTGLEEVKLYNVFFLRSQTKPAVSSVVPDNGASDVAAAGDVSITFTKQMDKRTAGQVSINGTALPAGTWSADGKTYTVPYSVTKNLQCNVTISGFTDPDGNVMDTNSEYSFATEAVYGIMLDKYGVQNFGSQTYGYAAQAPLSVIVTNTSSSATGALTVALSDASGFSLSGTSFASLEQDGSVSFTVGPKTGLAAGTYTAVVTVSGADAEPQSFQVKFIVTQAAGTFPALAALQTVYSPGLKLSDLLLPVNYTWAAPNTALSAGNGQQFGAIYTDPSGNYEAAAGIVTVNVAKMNGNFGAVAPINTTYAETLKLSDLLLPANYAWVAPDTALNAGDGQQFGAVYADLSGNYEEATGMVTVNVARAVAPTLDWPTASSIVYGQPLSASVLSGGSVQLGVFAWTDDVECLAVPGGSYGVTFTPDNMNYDWPSSVTNNIAVTVNKAEAAGVPLRVDAASGHAKAYDIDLTTLLPAIAAPLTMGAVTYAVKSAENTQGVLAAVPPAGAVISPLTLSVAGTALPDKTAVVTVTVSSANYADFDVPITIRTYAKTPVTISGVAMIGKVYDGTPCALTGTPVAMNGGVPVAGLALDVRYESMDGGGWDSASAPTDAGVYKVTISVPGSNPDYSGSAVYSFHIQQKQIWVTADDKSFKIGDAEPTYTFTQEGFVGPPVWVTVPEVVCPTADYSTEGDYSILVIGGDAGNNYLVHYQHGILTVAAKSSACEVLDVTSPANAQRSGTTITANVPNGTNSAAVGVIVSNLATWKLYSNEACTQEIAGKTMRLNMGANTAYIKVTAEDGTSKVYTIIITQGVLTATITRENEFFWKRLVNLITFSLAMKEYQRVTITPGPGVTSMQYYVGEKNADLRGAAWKTYTGPFYIHPGYFFRLINPKTVYVKFQDGTIISK